MRTARELFGDLTPVEDEILYRRGDVNDTHLGEVVSRNLANFGRADVVVIGCPQDEGVRRNRGVEAPTTHRPKSAEHSTVTR